MTLPTFCPAAAFIRPLAVCLALLSGSAMAQTVSLLRATELRADKLSSAAVLQQVPAGTPLRLLSLEGGWALVDVQGRPGWVRASAVNISAGESQASTQNSGRQAPGNVAVTLGVRSLPARANRHALIIGISRYADPATPPLPGARIDKESATQMATAMQVPASNIRYLQDSQATGDNIRAAIKALNEQVEEGDKVFIHYSGHGTRYRDEQAGGCIEALLAYDGGSSGTITNREMADLLKPITNKTDKLVVMYDACHSGGLVNVASTVRTRGLGNGNDEGLLRPKFASISDECGRPVNVKTRNLLVETSSKGALPQDIIHISAARENEISFDDELKGGLATEFMRDCMLRDARDLDGSGAISMDEIRICAQDKLDRRMKNDPNFKPHNITLSGNTACVPAWFSQASLAAIAPLPPAMPQPPAAPVAGPPPPAAMAAFSGEQALRQMFDQRDAKRRVQVTLPKDRLRIGTDTVDLAVQSDRSGFVYVALAGSDNQSLYLLFPNDLDQNNKIEAGQTLQLPRPNWRVRASGPAGEDKLLVLVSDGPRDLTALAASKAGPFIASLNNAQGRAELGALMSTSRQVTSQECSSPSSRKNNPLCSDAYGAALVSVQEFK